MSNFDIVKNFDNCDGCSGAFDILELEEVSNNKHLCEGCMYQHSANLDNLTGGDCE